MSLYELIEKIRIEIYNNMKLNPSELTKIINACNGGDMKAKKSLLKYIKEYISKNVKEDEINDLISQYHINYFEPLYEGDNEVFSNIFNKITINKDDPLEKRIDKLSQIAFQENYGLSVIDEFSYENISGLNEIGCNKENFIWFQFKGMKIYLPKLKFKNQSQYREVIKKSISFDAKRDLKPDNPEILCQRYNGARVTALCPPYSSDYSLNIRYFDDTEYITKEKMIELETSTEDIEKFTDNVMPGRPNIFIIGDQGCGKTTYLLRLIGSISNKLSIATLEPMFELNPDIVYPNKDIKKLQYLEYKKPTDAFKTCLRLNRDLIITGEVRLEDEAKITLQCMTRQNRGSLGSFHCTSAEDFIYDYKNLLMETGNYYSEYTALFDIARAVDLLYLLAIDRNTGRRYIKEITEIVLDRSNKEKPFKLNTIFKYDKTLEKYKLVNKLSDAFIEKVYEYEFNNKNMKELEKIYKKNNK